MTTSTTTTHPYPAHKPSGVKVGYEVSFTRHFYKPQRLRPLEEIRADILALERETEGLLGGDCGKRHGRLSCESGRAGSVLTDDDIARLIGLPKIVVNQTPSTGYSEVDNYRRRNLDLRAESDPSQRFSVFIRQNMTFIENYTIGLQYPTSYRITGTITLVRYNGPHGEEAMSPDGHFARPHIHYLTAQELAEGYLQPREKRRELRNL